MYKYSTVSIRGKPVRNSSGKVCGAIVGNTLRKRVKFSKHFLNKYQGFAWDCEILNSAERKNVSEILIEELEDGNVYRIPLSHFRKCGKEFDFGFGRQIACPLKYFTKSKNA